MKHTYRWSRIVLVLTVISVARESAAANRLVLRDGLEIVGDVEIEENRIVVRSGARILYIGSRQLARAEEANEVPLERFTLDQPVARTARPIGLVTNIGKITPFDVHGRRSVSLFDGARREYPIVQAITELYPTHVIVRGVEYTWRLGIDLSQIPSDILVPILDRAVEKEGGPAQLKLAHFLIQAGRFAEADDKLKQIGEKYPDLASQTIELTGKLRLEVTRRALDLAGEAQSLGRHRRARELETSLREYAVPIELEPKVREFRDELDRLDDRLAKARSLLAAEPTGAIDSQVKTVVEKARQRIANSISPTTLSRVEPMLTLAEQSDTSPAERLALAISGWVLGPTLAHRDLPRAAKEWEQAEEMVLYLGARDEVQRQQRMARLESLGLRADVAAQMLGLLPFPDSPSKPAQPFVATAATRDVGDVKYHVVLPDDYDRYGSYPALITLHGIDTPPEKQRDIWKPKTLEQGVILIVPEYRQDPTRPYEYSVREHTVLMEVIHDARKRFAIDADRLFLSGHELGGAAAWDFGMSHPDYFAGLIPFTASPRFYCVRYWPNLTYLPVYCVEGAMNGENPELTAIQFQRYFVNGLDATYCEYPGRGREWFAGEMDPILKWMRHKRRATIPAEIHAVSARHSDRQFYWVQADSFLPKATVPPELFGTSRFRPATIDTKVGDDNSLTITATGLVELTVLIPPGLVHLDDPELKIRANNKTVHRGPIVPDLDTLLREVDRTGDRKRVVVRKISVPRL